LTGSDKQQLDEPTDETESALALKGAGGGGAGNGSTGAPLTAGGDFGCSTTVESAC
jgi:hypothetical protein